MRDSHSRSFVKGVSWRALGTIDTITLSYIVTGSISDSIKIGITEVLTKIVLYYLHERVWDNVPFGRIHGTGPTHARSLAKGVSWRTVGTIDTMFVAYLITGVPLNALTIGGFEVFTKIGCSTSMNVSGEKYGGDEFQIIAIPCMLLRLLKLVFLKLKAPRMKLSATRKILVIQL